MKLIIQIPCFNEAETLDFTLKELPRKIEGFDEVEFLVIDDGSSDATSDKARLGGADHIVRLPANQGLARAFMIGLNACAKLGADVIVNTDGDNQYNGADVQKLVKPIIDGQADIVIGARPIDEIQSFSAAKKFLQKVGSAIVRYMSRTNIPDAPSGFRAMSREAALRLNVFNEYTYTLETIIQAGQKGLAVTSVPIRVNREARPSRLIRSTFSYIRKSIITMVRIFVVYKSFRSFMAVGLSFFFAGVLVGARFLYFYLSGEGGGHVQSLILASILLGIGFQTILVAFIADLLAVNRRMLEDVQYRIKVMECDLIKRTR
ncbi:MAG: glycosyltransferase [Geobacteraceae bacterium]|nr:glycosyltransferase [Geobacteraceae bacterium]